MAEIHNAFALSLEALATGMTHCFEDYVIPAVFTPNLLAGLVRVDSIDPANTLVAFDGTTMVGILLLCRRGTTARVGAMAVAKDHRSCGLGRQLMDRMISEAQARGDRRVVLEAISHNDRAISFYERCGFAIQYRLLGFWMDATSDLELPGVEEIDPRLMAQRLYSRTADLLSWECDVATVAQLAHPCRCFLFRGLSLAVSPAGDETLLVRAMGLSGENDSEKLGAIVAHLGGRFSRRRFRVPPYFPEPEYAKTLGESGFTEDPLSQVQMDLVLSSV